MSWFLRCGSGTKAEKRYQRNVGITMVIYLGLVFGCALIVKHGHPHGWVLYMCAVAPALPIICLLVLMGKYLKEETDEYVRLQTMRSLLVGTGSLMGTLVVNDFLRSFAGTGSLPPFWLFMTFFIGFGVAQVTQRVQNRTAGDE